MVFAIILKHKTCSRLEHFSRIFSPMRKTSIRTFFTAIHTIHLRISSRPACFASVGLTDDMNCFTAFQFRIIVIIILLDLATNEIDSEYFAQATRSFSFHSLYTGDARGSLSDQFILKNCFQIDTELVHSVSVYGTVFDNLALHCSLWLSLVVLLQE